MKTTNTNPIKTVLTISVGFMIIYLITEIKWTIYVSIAIGMVGLFSTYLSNIVNEIWMKISFILSLIVPNILLSAIYYFVLTPISILSKILSNNNPLNLKDNLKSTFKENNIYIEESTFEKPW